MSNQSTHGDTPAHRRRHIVSHFITCYTADQLQQAAEAAIAIAPKVCTCTTSATAGILHMLERQRRRERPCQN